MYTIVTQHHKVADNHDAIHGGISHDLCRCYILTKPHSVEIVFLLSGGTGNGVLTTKIRTEIRFM